MNAPGGAISVQVRLFAMLRECAGTGSVQLQLEPGATVADAISALSAQGPLGELLARMPVQMAVNREYAGTETVLAPGDEIALIPPVSGGAGSHREEGITIEATVTEEPLSIERLSRVVTHPEAGAVVVFEGVTREVPALEYEAYGQMALERIEAILRDCVAAHDLRGAAAAHRIGRVPLGEPTVIVAVSAAHRAEAFEGAREAIDAIKEQVPIWKREELRDGRSLWAAGAPGLVEPDQPGSSAPSGTAQ